MKTDEDVRDQLQPSRVTELVVVAFSAAAVIVMYRVDRRYRRWVRDTSLLAGPRERAVAFKSGYRRHRSRAVGATQTVGAILGTTPR